MDGYLSHFSAAKFWDIPNIELVLGKEIVERDSIDFTVYNRTSRFHKNGHTFYLCEHVLPKGAVVKKDGEIIASPELLFFQFASKLGIHRLILLGLQLCAHPPGKPHMALTTKKKLEAFLVQISGLHGCRNALRAVRYIADGSASIMESLVYMILTLPNAMGGYGLGGAVFNYEISLADEAKKRLGQERCFVDLYYGAKKVAVEYDSFTFHSSPTEQGKDSIRSSVLFKQGIEVLHMSTIQLYDKDACADFAFKLAFRLGKQIRIRTEKFKVSRELIRELLPVKDEMSDLHSRLEQ